jgi:hypothetical protein
VRPGVYPEVEPQPVLPAASEDHAAESRALSKVRAGASSVAGSVGDAGGHRTVECARRGELIAQGAAWDLGHVDGELAYSGPEHAECNRATAAHRVGRDGRRGSSRASRIW